MSTKFKTVAIAALIAVMAPLGANAETVKGEVTKIDADAGKITIKHGPIKKFDMDAMTMVFRAGDPAMLKQVKAGDKVTFEADKINGQFTVIKIEKAK